MPPGTPPPQPGSDQWEYVDQAVDDVSPGSLTDLLILFFRKNHYAPASQANWCNMTFTAGNLFSSHSCIGVT